MYEMSYRLRNEVICFEQVRWDIAELIFNYICNEIQFTVKSQKLHRQKKTITEFCWEEGGVG